MLNTRMTFYTLFLITISSLVVGCGGGGTGLEFNNESNSSSSDGSDDDGDNNNNNNEPRAPTSIISANVVLSVTDSFADEGVTVVQAGDTITYKFIDNTTISGAGAGNDVYPITSWKYLASGSSATIKLNYANGSSLDTLTFTAATGGTYESVITLARGKTASHSGSFDVSKDVNACAVNGTGQISIYTTVGNGGFVSVSIDGSSAGTLLTYFPTETPSCGTLIDPGVITRTLSAGTHSISATNSNTGWGPGDTTITECECLSYSLD